MTTMTATELQIAATITERRQLSTDVIELRLTRNDNHSWPEWTPGAHIDLILPDGSARQYSLAGSPQNREVLTVAILRDPAGRGGSRWLHDHARVGQVINIRGPRNHFKLQGAEQYLFVAAGIGITPILPMIEEAEARGVPWRLIYCARIRQDMAYALELAQYGSKVQLRPRDEYERIDFTQLFKAEPPGALTYVCGPERFLVAAEQAAAYLNIAPPTVERFAPKDFLDAVNTPFEVQVASDGRVFQIPADRTILSVLMENGVPVIVSCQEGTCGTCETGVVSGLPDHRDSVLTAQEQAANDYMMVCCSRSKCPRLVLDL